MASTASNVALGSQVISKKVKAAIQAKLKELGSYVDEELPDYIMVMIANKRTRTEMESDLALFLGPHTKSFTSWLHEILHRLHDVVVPSGGTNGEERVAESGGGGGDEDGGGTEHRKKKKKSEDKKRKRSGEKRKKSSDGGSKAKKEAAEKKSALAKTSVMEDGDTVNLVDEAVRDLFSSEISGESLASLSVPPPQKLREDAPQKSRSEEERKRRKRRAVEVRPPLEVRSSVGKISRAEECDDYEALRSKSIMSQVAPRPKPRRLPESLRPPSKVLLKALKDARTTTLPTPKLLSHMKIGKGPRTPGVYIPGQSDDEEDSLPPPPSLLLGRRRYPMPDPNSLGLSLLRANLERERRRNQEIQKQLRRDKEKEAKKLKELQRIRKEVKKREERERKAMMIQMAHVHAEAQQQEYMMLDESDVVDDEAKKLKELRRAAKKGMRERKTGKAQQQKQEFLMLGETETVSDTDDLGDIEEGSGSLLGKLNKDMLDKITITVRNDLMDETSRKVTETGKKNPKAKKTTKMKADVMEEGEVAEEEEKAAEVEEVVSEEEEESDGRECSDEEFHDDDVSSDPSKPPLAQVRPMMKEPVVELQPVVLEARRQEHSESPAQRYSPHRRTDRERENVVVSESVADGETRPQPERPPRVHAPSPRCQVADVQGQKRTPSQSNQTITPSFTITFSGLPEGRIVPRITANEDVIIETPATAPPPAPLPPAPHLNPAMTSLQAAYTAASLAKMSSRYTPSMVSRPQTTPACSGHPEYVPKSLPAASSGTTSTTRSKRTPIVYSLPPEEKKSESSSAASTTTPTVVSTTAPQTSKNRAFIPTSIVPPTLAFKETPPSLKLTKSTVKLSTLVAPPSAAGSIKERCKFFPNCRFGNTCAYVHPSTPCRKFPVCLFGDKCLYIHPPCKYNGQCTNSKCSFSHNTRKTITKNTEEFAKPSLGTSVSSGTKACYFGEGCTNASCTFSHPLGKKIYKWVPPS